MKIDIKVLLFFSYVLSITCQNPFSVLGIPTLNPSQMFKEEVIKRKQNHQTNVKYALYKLKSIEDVPQFLQKAHLNSEDAVKIISKFLISDDYMMKKYGAVYDQTGFDEIMNLESISPVGSKTRLMQRARSAAKIYFNNNYEHSGYDVYGAEKMSIFNVPIGWEVYKVLLVGKTNVNDHLFLKVCLPFDEMLTAIVADFTGDCVDKIKYVEEAKVRNSPYLEKIKQNYFKSEINEIKEIDRKVTEKNSFDSNKMKITNPPKNDNVKINIKDTPSFLSKNEKEKVSKTTPNLRPNNLNQISDLELEVKTINEKLNKLEDRVDKNEKITYTTQEDVKDLKSNLDKNFNKLDTILEKLADKLK